MNYSNYPAPFLLYQVSREQIPDGSALISRYTTLFDLTHQNQSKLQSILSDNINTTIVDGIKELAAQTADKEKEQQLNCVQCDMPYCNSTNGPKSCNFHSAEYNTHFAAVDIFATLATITTNIILPTPTTDSSCMLKK